MWQKPISIGEYLESQYYEPIASGQVDLHHHPEIISTEFVIFPSRMGRHSLPTPKSVNEQQAYKATKYVDSAAYCRDESAHLLIISNVSL